MASYTTTTRTVRIKNEVAEYFAGKPLNRAIEGVYEEIQSGSVALNEDGSLKILKDGSVHTQFDISDEDCNELKSMMNFMGGERAFFHGLVGLLSEGAIMNDRGVYTVNDVTLYVGDFKEVCHDMGLDCQKVLDDATKKLRKGLL